LQRFSIICRLDHESSIPRPMRRINPGAFFAGERREQLNVKRYAVLKDLVGNPEDPDFGMAWEQPAGETDAPNPVHECVRFRASLWLSLAADVRRRCASQEMKGMAPC
jgi:hypothetical protein